MLCQSLHLQSVTPHVSLLIADLVTDVTQKPALVPLGTELGGVPHRDRGAGPGECS